MIRAVQGPPLTDSKNSQTFRTDTKGAAPLPEFQKNKGEQFGLVPKLCADAEAKSKKHINSSSRSKLQRKQGRELLEMGSKQAARMGIRQALGLLLTELVNGLFNELKTLISHGIEAGRTLFEDLRQRLLRVIEAVARKIPDAATQMLQGGASGFISNRLTFLLNNLVSTAKRFVTAIREGFLGLVKAFKMILFPPATMTSEEALREGLKILSAVVASTVGLLILELVNGFMLTVPFLAPGRYHRAGFGGHSDWSRLRICRVPDRPPLRPPLEIARNSWTSCWPTQVAARPLPMSSW